MSSPNHLADHERDELLALLLEEEGVQPHPRSIRRRDAQSQTAVSSFAQQRLWFFDRLNPATPAYNMPGVIRLKGKLILPVLERALEEIIRRHEVLRTTFTADSGTPLQVIHPPFALRIPVTDLSGIVAADRDAAVERLRRQEAEQVFDLSTGPLISLRALLIAAEECLLLVTIHHIAFDGWSSGIFIHELSTLYASFLAGQPTPLRELDFQYADFSVWQREEFTSGALASQMDYWKAQLAEPRAATRLPTTHPRPTELELHGKHRAFPIAGALAARLNELSARENASLYITMLAAFFALLHRYSVPLEGVSDILVGSPIANRNHSGLENLIGFFVNTLVIRARVERQMPFIDLLRQVRATCLDAYANQDIPFDKLVEELAPARSVNTTPLFQVVFASQNLPPSTLKLAGLEVELMEGDSGSARFDLVFDIVQHAGDLRLVVTYKTALFDDEGIERMVGHYTTLLASAVETPTAPISHLRLLTDAEQRRQIHEWNRTAAPIPETCLHQLFEKQAALHPNAPAVLFENQSFTYAETDALATRYAALLQANGVSPERPVALFAERSIALVPVLLGILKAGGVYLPIDSEYPPERINYILEQAQPALILTQQKLRERIPQTSLPILCIDDLDAAGKSEFKPVDLHPRSLAYILYTSGSTGQPKGVMIPHRGIVNRVLWTAQVLRTAPGDRTLHKSPLVFDVSIGEIFLPLATGATLVIAAPGKHWDPEYLADLIQERGISFVHFVPSMLSVFLDADRLPEKTASLKNVWSGGEALTAELQSRFFARIQARLRNGYGPTEASVGVLWEECVPEAQTDGIYLGRPIANTACYIVDPDFNLLPPGVAGEILIGGVSLARGYLGHPELTAERFVRNPFLPVAGERLYRTGDLGYYTPEGRIAFLGRIDNQVKVRGFRIELGEIEATLRRHPQIQASVVLAESDKLIGYCQPCEGQSPDSMEIRSFVGRFLPAYMVPGTIVVVSRFPLTVNGKIDIKALPKACPPVALTEKSTQPANQAEQFLAGIWKTVLGVSSISIDENFFDSGGHSLLMIQVQMRINQSWPRPVTLVELFTHPTIRQMAAYMSNGACSNAESAGAAENRAARQRSSLITQGRQIKRIRSFSAQQSLS